MEIMLIQLQTVIVSTYVIDRCTAILMTGPTLGRMWHVKTSTGSFLTVSNRTAQRTRPREPQTLLLGTSSGRRLSYNGKHTFQIAALLQLKQGIVYSEGGWKAITQQRSSDCRDAVSFVSVI